MCDMGHNPWELRDPAATLDGMARRHELRPGLVVVGLVEHPDTIQQLLDTTIVYEQSPAPGDVRDCAKLIRTAARRLYGPRLTAGLPRHSFVTVVIRQGAPSLCVDDRRWLAGWRLSDHRLDVWTGELILLTEHGWCSSSTHHATGAMPSLAVAA